MSDPWPQTGQVTAFVLLGFVVLAVPAGLTSVHGPVGSTDTAESVVTRPGSVVTPTLPPTDLTETSTGTASPTSEPTPSSSGDTSTTDTGPTAGRTLVVDNPDPAGSGVVGSGTECPDAAYTTIQRAVDEAESGDTVLVCGGTYTESVAVETPDLAVRARGNVTIMAGPEVGFNVTAPNDTIAGFTVHTNDGGGIRVGADRAVIRDNTVRSTAVNDGNTEVEQDGIRLVQTNRSVIRNNTVLGFPDNGISVGEDGDLDTWGNGSHHNLIVGNTQTGLPSRTRTGIFVGTQAPHTILRNNTVTHNRHRAVIVWGNHSTVVDNRLKRNDNVALYLWGQHTLALDNTIDKQAFGLVVGGEDADAIGNTITNSSWTAISVGTFDQTRKGSREPYARILENTITNNNGFFTIYVNEQKAGNVNVTKTEIHRNLIVDNSAGILNDNGNKTDGFWPILDATNNIWDCGGPSSGRRTSSDPTAQLQDPYTGRLANGTGGQISAGDEPGVSNVHFDPFRVHNPSSCLRPQPTRTPPSSPTSTTTPTGTPTSIETPTDSPTRTPVQIRGTGGPDGGAGPGAGRSGENGTDASGTEDDTSGGEGPAGETATPPPGETDTPERSPTPTASPTPVVEPGFGVGVWVSGLVLVIWLLLTRRGYGVPNGGS